MKRMIMIFILSGIVVNLMGQRVDINRLNPDQLNFYKARAIKLRNTGMIISLTGVAALGVGYAILDNSNGSETDITTMGVTGLVFFSCELIGIPIWVTGGVRKHKANVGLKRFELKTPNAMALGVEVVLKF